MFVVGSFNIGVVVGATEFTEQQKRCRMVYVHAPHYSELSLEPRLFSSSTTTPTNNSQPPPPRQIRVADFVSIQKAQIPHFWSLEICGVDSTPLTRLAPSPVHFLRHLYNFSSTTLLHNQPQIPSQPKALIEIMFLSCCRSTELLHYIYYATNKANLPTTSNTPLRKHQLLILWWLPSSRSAFSQTDVLDTSCICFAPWMDG
jgi:hypothetical protein